MAEVDKKLAIETAWTEYKRNGFGRSGVNCAYRTDTGAHCAVGANLVGKIPEEHWVWEFRGSLEDLVARTDEGDLIRQVMSLDEPSSEDFWDQLQITHDMASSYYGATSGRTEEIRGEQYKGGLMFLAKSHGVEVTLD